MGSGGLLKSQTGIDVAGRTPALGRPRAIEPERFREQNPPFLHHTPRGAKTRKSVGRHAKPVGAAKLSAVDMAPRPEPPFALPTRMDIMGQESGPIRAEGSHSSAECGRLEIAWGFPPPWVQIPPPPPSRQSRLNNKIFMPWRGRIVRPSARAWRARGAFRPRGFKSHPLRLDGVWGTTFQTLFPYPYPGLTLATFGISSRESAYPQYDLHHVAFLHYPLSFL